VKLAFHQFCPERGDPERNAGRIREVLAGADLDLVVLPELALSGYLFRDRAEALGLADPVPGRSTEALAECCARGGFHLVCGIAERDGDRLYNTAVLVGPGGLVGRYRKVHLFRFERGIFDRGDSEFEVFEVGGARVGMLVCFDWIFPEAARSLALAGADVIAHPSNLVLPFAQDALVTRCLENRVYWVLANRTGAESQGDLDLAFTGCSRIGGPDGSILAEAGPEADVLGIADVDTSRARDKRATPENDLFEDRHPHLYGRITSR
jgi:predicted amidohydrolase